MDQVSFHDVKNFGITEITSFVCVGKRVWSRRIQIDHPAVVANPAKHEVEVITQWITLLADSEEELMTSIELAEKRSLEKMEKDHDEAESARHALVKEVA